MKTIQFKCRLLSDVILNQKAATEGPNSTLDFIPGSCFLGIVANHYAKFEQEGTAMELFHSGKVRFGDAHPSQDGIRGLKIPASMFYPKLGSLYDELFIHHAIPELSNEAIRDKQLKQCRDGFYTFDKSTAQKVATKTNFAIKSAYDRELRRSKDEQMFGYESLQKGLELYFDVEVENDDLSRTIVDALIGKKRIGRSRTAQYGLVEITETSYKEIKSSQASNSIITIYADGRLIFLDRYGIPTFCPSEEQLGLPKSAHILWEKSQIRTFQYSPWNYKRQGFDTDRCGIEKGSVIVVDISMCDTPSTLTSQYIGSYQNEGFGKVIYNPSFLSANEDGTAICTIVKGHDNSDYKTLPLKGTPLLDFVRIQQEHDELARSIYKMVNEWLAQNRSLFLGKKKFSSQWGAIRDIAMSTPDDAAIKQRVVDFISHGVKAVDWDGIRSDKLKEFMDNNSVQGMRNAIVNLASEMAKEMQKGE